VVGVAATVGAEEGKGAGFAVVKAEATTSVKGF
jgi:hypothetical protein